MAVIIAATAHCSALAGTTHVPTLNNVTQALEGAVVLAPSVLDLRVAEAHVIVEPKKAHMARFVVLC